MSRIQQAFSSLGGRGAETVAYSGNGAIAAPAAAAPAFAAWGEGFGSWGSSDGNGNAATLDRDTAGFLVGGDAAIGAYGRAGFLAGYQSSSYDANARSSSADATLYHLGLYGGTAWRGVNLRAGAAYSWADIDTARTAAFTGFSDYLTGSTDGGTAQVFSEAGYEVVSGPVALEPFAGSRLRLRRHRWVLRDQRRRGARRPGRHHRGDLFHAGCPTWRRPTGWLRPHPGHRPDRLAPCLRVA